jgi:tetratricopeptide (TPR) repeat protein
MSRVPTESFPDEGLQVEIDEALLALDELLEEDPEEALTMFDSLPEPVQALPDFQLLLARAQQRIGQLDAALDLLVSLDEKMPDSGDLHHQLGDVLEDMGRTADANQHFLKVRVIDEGEYVAVPHDTRERFERVLDTCLTDIAEHLAREGLASNCRPQVLALPSPDDVLAGRDPRRLAYLSAEDNLLTAYSANIFAECSNAGDDSTWQQDIRAIILLDLADDLDLRDETLTKLGVRP